MRWVKTNYAQNLVCTAWQQGIFLAFIWTCWLLLKFPVLEYCCNSEVFIIYTLVSSDPAMSYMYPSCSNSKKNRSSECHFMQPTICWYSPTRNMLFLTDSFSSRMSIKCVLLFLPDKVREVPFVWRCWRCLQTWLAPILSCIGLVTPSSLQNMYIASE